MKIIFRKLVPNNVSDLDLFLLTEIIARSAFFESFKHKLGLKN